jgi:copper chaperone CopZ
MEKITETIAIEGMTCGNCVRHVRQALEEIEGVEVCEIQIGSAEISYDPASIDRNAIIEAIKDEGYTVANN